MRKTTSHRLPGMTCPHCEGKATTTGQRLLDPLVREVRYRCDDDSCGHGFVAQIAIIRTTIQSAAPNPSVHLPFVPLLRQAANQNHPCPANDDAPPEAMPATMTG